MALENTHWGAERISDMLCDCRSVFFIGIGGVSMCSLAEITLKDGMRVLGSDRVESERTVRLRGLGAEIFLTHEAEHIQTADAVVYTVAIGEDNPEYVAAKERGIPLISRADYLGYLMMRYPIRIGVSGMNGKSTTTAMCAHILMQVGDPTVFCGAEATEFGGSSCHIGEGRDQMVFEACEYMDSFLDFNPTLAVILNIEMDHVDYFQSMGQIRASFRSYAERTGENGLVLINRDDEQVLAAMRDFTGELITYSTKMEGADFYAKDITSQKGLRSFDWFCRGELLGRISLPVPGWFQVDNALAAACASYLCGVPPKQIIHGLESYHGIKRRMERRGCLNGADVFDDYAHHPTAIAGTLAGAREMGYRRILCAYQPHTYSRTAGLFSEFACAFDAADRVYLADIYAAREKNESGVTSKALAEAVGERATYCGSLSNLAETLQREAQEGDLLLIMGAGDIEDVFQLLPLDLISVP